MKEHNSNPGGETASLWVGTFVVPTFPALGGDARCDVCVIGAGITGLSTAYTLAKAGKKVIVLDSGPIGGGETGRTTAHLANAMDERTFVLEHVHGEDGARKIVESHGIAIDRIEQIVRDEKIDCDFTRLDGYLFSAEGDSDKVIDEELAAAARVGLIVDKLPSVPGVSFASGPCVRYANQAQFHVLKYLAGVADAFVRAGGRIYTDTHASAVNGGSSCTVETQSKHKITADAVCVCTNSPVTDMVTTHVKQAPYRTCAIAAVVPRGSVPLGLYWDTANPYHYVRLNPLDAPAPGALGDEQYDALIVGGEDFKTGHATDEEHRWQKLESWMRARFPQAREVIYRWSGEVFEPNDYIAFIGPNPDGAKNVYIATGDSGQGMTHGTIASLLLSDLILGKPNDWTQLYDPHRVSLRAQPIADFIKQNADVALQYVKDKLTPGETGRAQNIPPGEGALIRQGTAKLAVFRDEQGKLHSCSAACTHLRCTVHWNGVEKSWDCPCHGSRFDPYGKVITGPALTDLEKVPIE